MADEAFPSAGIEVSALPTCSGRGAFANDRPPVLTTIGRDSAQVRLRVVDDTKQTTLRAHVERFTLEGSHIYTDDYTSYNTVDRPRAIERRGHQSGRASEMQQ